MSALTLPHIDALTEEWRRRDWPRPTDDEARQYLAQIRDRLRDDPLLMRYAGYLRAMGDAPRNTQPWHALAEKRLMALWAASEAPGIYGKDTSMSPLDTLGLVFALLGAHTYLWTEEMFQLAYHMPVPRHTIAKTLVPYPWMYFSYETAHGIRITELDGDVIETGREANWVLLRYHPEGLDVVTDTTLKQFAGSLILNGGEIRFGTIYPDDIPLPAREATRQVLAMLALLNSPYIAKTEAKLPRGIRRDYARAKKPIDDESITSVVLRRLIHTSTEDGTGIDREYSWRWWVSGHIRAQWYPSLQGHKLIWIAPYVKGPDDKPIKETVYHVKR